MVKKKEKKEEAVLKEQVRANLISMKRKSRKTFLLVLAQFLHTYV